MRELLTSHSQACWTERIQKETAARVAWHRSYGPLRPRGGPWPRRPSPRAPPRSAPGPGPVPAASSPDSEWAQAGRPETKGGQGQPSRRAGAQGAPAERGRVWEARGAALGPAGLEMRPVPPGTLRLLFQGTSHEGQGRALYLRARRRQEPREKFRYPSLSSWEHGWHVGDAKKDSNSPTYGRFEVVSKTFYFQSGVFHCPRRTDQLM